MPLQLNSESDAFLITDPINIRGKGIILITVGHESFLGERGEAWGENKAGRGAAAARNIKKDCKDITLQQIWQEVANYSLFVWV